MIKPTEHKTTRMPALATLFAVAIALSACTGAPDQGTSPVGPSTPAAPASGSTARGNETLMAAARTARDTVGSGTVASVDQEATSWEVLIVAADGTEREVHVAPDGSSVISGPTEHGTDAEDRTENMKHLADAKLDLAEAVSKIVAASPGTITELGLDDHAGVTVWEADVRDAQGVKHEVRIDAASGDVVTNVTGG